MKNKMGKTKCPYKPIPLILSVGREHGFDL